MSAVREGRADDGAYHFALDRPIPAYLIALACGELASREISERCAIWAEPDLVEAAAYEFADTEQMIQRAEELFGAYRWGRYDVLVLPPSFPYGGMENPLLTFLTPTVIAGDRSLVSIIAHELAHSWSGNLVTNATWSDFWLNEGTTVYFERRIMERLYGRQRVSMEASLDMDSLERTIARQEPWQSVLHIDLDGRHPDDGFSSVPYNKGAAFLTRIEKLVGRERFDVFLASWFDEHAFQSVTTADFERFLRERLPSAASGIDLQQWIHEPGLPPDTPSFESDALQLVEAEHEALLQGSAPSELQTGTWVTQQWLHFLERLPASQRTSERLAELDRAFELTASGNSEVLCAWLGLTIEAGYGTADERLESFLGNVGRRKYLQPLYEKLLQHDRTRARSLYGRFRERYHSVSTGTLDRILEWTGE